MSLSPRAAMALAFAALALNACSSSPDAQPEPASQEAAAGVREAGADGAVGADADAGTDVDSGATRADGATAPAAFVDARDGKSYATFTAGGHTWLARNLDHEMAGSSCYGGDPQSCAAHGRLYTWTAAQTACPAGTHLGSDDEWKSLETALGMPAADLDREGYSTARGSREGESLKDAAGFGATMAGFGTGAGYDALGDRTYFWTSSTRAGEVWRRRVAAATPTVFRFTNPPSTFAISVRCVLD